MARRYEVARRAAELNSDEYRAAVERFETVRPTAVRKPETPAEALAWLITVAEHVWANLEEYREHKPPGPAVGPLYAQWLSDRAAPPVVCRCGEGLRLGETPEKSGTASRPKGRAWSPRGSRAAQQNPGKAAQDSPAARRQSPTRQTRQTGRPTWKEIGRACGMTPQAAKRLYERELSNLHEALAKEIAARMKQKPPPIGMAKARSAAPGKKSPRTIAAR